MKTLQEIKKEYARQNGYVDWNSLIDRLGYQDRFINEVAKRYAKEVAKQALKNTSENAKTYVAVKSLGYDPRPISKHLIDKASITNENNISELI